MPASDVLATVKLRLEITGADQDTLITSFIDEVGQRILHYCNILEIPVELGLVWASMTIDALRIEQPNIPEIANTNGGAAAEIQIGDTSIKDSELTNASKAIIAKVVLNYRTDLTRYRKLRW